MTTIAQPAVTSRLQWLLDLNASAGLETSEDNKYLRKVRRIPLSFYTRDKPV